MPDWSEGKQLRVYILLAIILVLTASFLTFDWTQYYFGIERVSDPEWMYTRINKILTSALFRSLRTPNANIRPIRRVTVTFLVGFYLAIDTLE